MKSFRITINPDRELVQSLVGKYVSFHDTLKYGKPKKGEFVKWFKVQVMMFGTDTESQCCNHSDYEMGEEAYVKWFGK